MKEFILRIIIDTEGKQAEQTYFGKASDQDKAVSNIYDYIMNESWIDDEKTKDEMADRIRYLLRCENHNVIECKRYKTGLFKTNFVTILANIEEA